MLFFGFLLLKFAITTAERLIPKLVCADRAPNTENIELRCEIHNYITHNDTYINLPVIDDYNYTLKTMKKLKFVNSTLKHCPKNLLELMPKLVEINIQSSHLESISNTIFSDQKYRAMDSLIFTNNELTIIDNRTFSGASNLRLLDLSRNNITLLQKEAFYNLRTLRILNLAHNQIQQLEQEVFQNVPTVSVIWLNNNQLTSFDSATLIRNNKLKSLILSHNKITIVEATKVDQNNILTRLSVKDNHIQDITNLTLAYTHLKTLDVSYNPQLQLKSSTFTKCKDLNYLSLAGINWRQDFKQFSDLKNLFELNVGENDLTFIDFGSFPYLDNLETLIIDKTPLQYVIPYGLRGSLPFLEVVVLTVEDTTDEVRDELEKLGLQLVFAITKDSRGLIGEQTIPKTTIVRATGNDSDLIVKSEMANSHLQSTNSSRIEGMKCLNDYYFYALHIGLIGALLILIVGLVCVVRCKKEPTVVARKQQIHEKFQPFLSNMN